MLRVIRKPIHEGLVSLILQYVGTKEMENDVNDVVLPICRHFHPKGRIGRGGEGRHQRVDMIGCWYVQDYNDLAHQLSTRGGALKWEA